MLEEQKRSQPTLPGISIFMFAIMPTGYWSGIRAVRTILSVNPVSGPMFTGQPVYLLLMMYAIAEVAGR